MDFAQTNELQDAIDEMTGKTAEPEVGSIADQFGVPPMPPMEGAGAPEVAAPEVPTMDLPTPEAPASEPVAAEPTVAEAVSTEPTVAPETVPVSTPTAVAGDEVEEVRKNILKDLLGTGLIDKTSAQPEEKFQIFMEAIESTHDKSLVSGAYKAASQIADENAKAEGLIKLMQVIDVLK